MKTRAVIVTAAAGLALAGRGAGATLQSHGPPKLRVGRVFTFTAPTTTTIANPHTGAAVRCVNHGDSAGVIVPSASHGVSGSADGKSTSASLNVNRNNDGSLVVSCTP
jgi:hypothetical protein